MDWINQRTSCLNKAGPLWGGVDATIDRSIIKTYFEVNAKYQEFTQNAFFSSHRLVENIFQKDGFIGFKLKNGIIVVLIFALNCAAINVRDFAPLSVGNTWQYKGFISDNIAGWATEDSIDALIKLNSKSTTGDTIKYQFLISEKHFSRNHEREDTTIDKIVSQYEIHDTILGGGEWQASEAYQNQLFESHSYPDSVLKNSEINGSIRSIFCKESFSERKKCFAQDIGPTYIYSNPYSGGHASHKLEYYLREFNGVKVEGQLVVGINSKREITQSLKSNDRVSSKNRLNRLHLFKNSLFNLLGRVGRSLQF